VLGVLARLERASQQAARYRWYALAITTFCQAAAVSISLAAGPLAPLLQEDLHISRAEVGLVGTAIWISSTSVALIGGRAADRVGERRVLLVSGLLSGLAALAIARAGEYWTYLAFCFLLGIGNGVQNPAGSAAIMRWFPPRQRGFAMGIRQTGVPIAGILSAIIWPAVALAHGWRAAYLLGGLAALVSAALIFGGYFDPPRPAGAERQPPTPFASLLRDPRVRWLALIYNGQVMAQFCASTYFVLFLHEVLEIPLVAASALLALINGVAIAARIAWGSFSDRRFGGQRRPVLRIVVGLTLIGTLAAAALPPGAPAAVALPLAFALACLLGVSAFAWTGILGTLVIESVGRHSAATAIAVVSALGSPGSLVGPPLFGLIVDQTGSYRLAWLAVAAPVAAGLLALRRVGEQPAQSV
jgi:predicted MFS family arabinose efflux permease